MKTVVIVRTVVKVEVAAIKIVTSLCYLVTEMKKLVVTV
jgi:hypothetical protein